MTWEKQLTELKIGNKETNRAEIYKGKKKQITTVENGINDVQGTLGDFY